MASTDMPCGCVIHRDQITEEYELTYCIAHEGNALYIETLEIEVAAEKYNKGLVQANLDEAWLYIKALERRNNGR